MFGDEGRKHSNLEASTLIKIEGIGFLNDLKLANSPELWQDRGRKGEAGQTRQSLLSLKPVKKLGQHDFVF